MSSNTLHLKIYLGEQLVDSQSLTQEVIKIGRLKSSHICLEEEGVARMHAVIEGGAGDVRVIDLGSSAGTILNGQPVDKNAPLATGDVLTIGPFRIEVEVASSQLSAGGSRVPHHQEPNAPSFQPQASQPRASAPMPPQYSPAVAQVDLSSVEHQDGRQVAEVVAIYGSTVLDVQHVGQSQSKKGSSMGLITVGSLLLLAGVGLFGYEVSRDWDKYNKEVLVAQQTGALAPRVPGLGTQGLGFGLAFLGLIPLVLGATRRNEKVISDYTIGEGHEAVFHVPPTGLPDPVAFPLVRGSTGEYALNFTGGMNGEVTLDGRQISLEELVHSGRAGSHGSHYTFPLPQGARARLRYGDITFMVNSVNPGVAMTDRGDVDKPLFMYVGGTGIVSLALAALVLSIPDDYLSMDFDEDLGENRFARYMFQPDELLEEEPPPEEEDSDEEAGGTGQRHKGEEGKMGKPTSKQKSGLYAMKGPKDAIPQMARNFDPDLAARNAGILGVMQQQSGHFLASPFGGAFAVGNDDEDVWGGLTGTEVGEAYGVGGLGLVGTGRGGGGTGEGTIGLGNTGLIGKGGGGGTGSGYGRGAGAGFGGRGKRVPRVRQARAKVQGGMDKNIIRRIVRAHINEVRACYNQGLNRNPNLRGRVAINFMITSTGKVGTSVVQSSTLKDRSVANCIAKAVKRWKFPKPRGGGNAIVTYPFTLNPG